MRGYDFKSPVDPNKPLDQTDPPPKGWDELDTQDFRRHLFGSGLGAVGDCVRWEERELVRHG